jgi:small subunit ribosomal protein S5
MPAKEIKQNEISAKEVKVPPTGVPVEEIAPEAAAPAAAGKVTPGRRVRDAARMGMGGGRPGGAPGAGGPRGGGRGGPRGGGRGGERGERVKPEFDSRIIDIRRVTRVTAGGRRMNFSVAVVAGDRKGRVGVGLGKGNDTASAVEKATREAK